MMSASGGDGLFEVGPVEMKRLQGRRAAVDKRFRAFDPHLVLLLPPSLDDWLPQDHLARFVADLVDDVTGVSATASASSTSTPKQASSPARPAASTAATASEG